jgi:hypothetical protein
MGIKMSSTNKHEANKLTKSLKVDTGALSSATALSSAIALELTTLSNMVDLSNKCIKFLDSLQDQRHRFLLDIKNNENDFFEKNPLIGSQFNTLFDPTIYKGQVQTFLSELEDAVENYCCHEYIEDIVDIGYERSQRVVYCQLCEVTKVKSR